MVCPPLWWCWVQGACTVPSFCLGLFKSGSWFFGLFASFVLNLPQLHTHTVIFHPLQFLCILLFRQVCPDASTATKVPRSQPVPL